MIPQSPTSRPRRWTLPECGAVFVAANPDGTWAGQYRYSGLHNGNPHVGEFADEHGELCVIPFAQLKRMGLAGDEPDAGEQLDNHLHRTRSRKTERQRAHGQKATAKQIQYIVTLGRQRGLDVDELRALAPQRSLSSLTIGEASRMIDRLKGAYR